MYVCDYVLEDAVGSLPVSAPEPGSACEHHGEWSFGVSAPDLWLASLMEGHTVHVRTPSGRPIARFDVEHVDRELSVVTGDFRPEPRVGQAPQRKLLQWLNDLFRHWDDTPWPPRLAPPGLP